MVWTSGLPVQQGRNAPSSKFFITPANATAQHGSPSSSTVSQNCLVVRDFQNKHVNNFSKIQFIKNNGSTMTDPWMSPCAVSPAWILLCMMTISTWCAWKCMHISCTHYLLCALLKQWQSKKKSQLWVKAFLKETGFTAHHLKQHFISVITISNNSVINKPTYNVPSLLVT